MSFFNAIISAIMSFLMLIFPFLGPEIPESQVITGGLKLEAPYTDKEIFYTYREWKAACPDDTVYTEEFFEENSLACVHVTLSGTHANAKVESVIESGNTAIITYSVHYKGVGATILCVDTILATVSKNITNIETVNVRIY